MQACLSIHNNITIVTRRQVRDPKSYVETPVNFKTKRLHTVKGLDLGLSTLCF